MSRTDVVRMIQRRAADASLSTADQITLDEIERIAI